MAKKGTILETAFATYKISDKIGDGGSGVVYAVESDEGCDVPGSVDTILRCSFGIGGAAWEQDGGLLGSSRLKR